ncbi:MAG: trypsin-like serine protease [Verrucomicrobia bacterium]|nr:trypsin-like serine protease [Verrucomicrobiota bacterium]
MTSLPIKKSKFSPPFLCRAWVSFAGGVAALALIWNAQGAFVPTAADIPAAQALGAAQEDTVWYKGTVNTNSVYASGTLIRGRDYDWVLTAAHVIRFPGGTIGIANMTVGNGTSYKSDLGDTAGVSSIFISPTYVPGTNGGADYAFLRLDRRISSANLVFTLGAAPRDGDPILFAGFGLPSSLAEGTLPNAGYVMGFYARYNSANVPGWNPADDLGLFADQHDSGVANDRDSGGSVKQFNPSTGRWQNIGTIIGSDFSTISIFYPYHKADQAFLDYLANTVQPVASPSAPPQVKLITSPTTAQLTFTNLDPTREYRVMRSSTSATWEEANRFTATTTTGTWSEPLAPDGRRFYRLEWNQ